MNTIDYSHALGTDSGGYHGKSMCHGLADLPLNSSPIAQRRNKNCGTSEVWIDIGYITHKLHPFSGLRGFLWVTGVAE